MPGETRINRELDIIEIRAYGTITEQEIRDSIDETRDLVKTWNINSICIDTTGQTSMPGFDTIYSIFSELPKEFRVALIISNTQMTVDEITFAETVARNRGRLIRVFLNSEDAVEWLKTGRT